MFLIIIIFKNYFDHFVDIPYPRLPWYNYSAVGHVPFIAAEPAVGPEMDDAAVFAFYERFRALMAVDDIVTAVVELLEQTGAIDNTCILPSLSRDLILSVLFISLVPYISTLSLSLMKYV